MATPRKKKPTQSDRPLRALDAEMPLCPEHETQRALWSLRLLLKAGTSPRSRSALADPDTATELGFLSARLDSLSPRALRRWLEHRLAQLEQRELAPDATVQNATWLAQWLGLSELERKLLAFATTAEASEAVSVCLHPFARLASIRAIQLLASVLAEPADAVRAALSPTSALMRSGVLQFRPGRDAHHNLWIGLEHPFDIVLASHYERPEELFAVICPLASDASLELDAFAHLSTDLALLLALLRGAQRERAAGVNVLLHGPPGSGKSQLVRSLARALGAPLFQVPDTAPDGELLKGPKRLAALGAMQCLLQSTNSALVLFDEIEDAFPWSCERGWLRQGSGNDKARTNRLLEENAVPCVWVGNSIEQLDPAFVRRFALVLEVAAPPLQVRQRLLADYASGLAVSVELQRRLAENSWVVPADAARAARVTRLARRGEASSPLEDALVFERALRGGRRAEPQRSGGELDYDPKLVNTSVPLERLTSGLSRRGQGSICLYGPPGTGKTAFARQLASALGRPLLQRSAGDLLDMYVGGTERAIVDMFDEASRSPCVLLLDEAEGMLRHRGTAVRGFEVTMVNELLVRMEAFGGIFLCATNGFDSLDPAALRRFALRIEFSALHLEQKLVLFERTAQQLGLPLGDAARSMAQRRLSRLTLLTPGDYASLLRGRQLLGDASVEALLDDLERAHAEKRAERRVGFRR